MARVGGVTAGRDFGPSAPDASVFVREGFDPYFVQVAIISELC